MRSKVWGILEAGDATERINFGRFFERLTTTYTYNEGQIKMNSGAFSWLHCQENRSGSVGRFRERALIKESERIRFYVNGNLKKHSR